jgi:hypothetical protein
LFVLAKASFSRTLLRYATGDYFCLQQKVAGSIGARTKKKTHPFGRALFLVAGAGFEPATLWL